MAYTLAYLRLMQEMGVPCIYVSGEEHAWNMVKLRSRWYSVDVTWDDATDAYSYFLKGTKDFRQTIGEIAMLICYEATRQLQLSDVEIETPICKTTVKELKGKKIQHQ